MLKVSNILKIYIYFHILSFTTWHVLNVGQWFSKYGPWNSNINLIWEFVRNAESRIPSQFKTLNEGTKQIVLISLPSNYDVH